MLKNTPKPRAIRSFVRRCGRMSDMQKNALATLQEQYCLKPTAELINLDNLFQRQAPRVLEIGFGMGQSLLAQAIQHPGQDYLGIEVHQPGIASLLAGIAEHQLTNIRIINADAVEILTRSIADNSLDFVQIFFPDPWQKRRHHKRRLIQTRFVELLWKKLKPEGKLYLATDWEDYAKQMLAVLSTAKGFKNLAGEGQFAPRPEERPLTKFELRGQRLGHLVRDLIFIKI